MLPIVEVDVDPDQLDDGPLNAPLDKPRIVPNVITPISPDPPDVSVFSHRKDGDDPAAESPPTGEVDALTPEWSDTSTPTGQIDALTPEVIAATAPTGQIEALTPEVIAALSPTTDQHDAVPHDDAIIDDAALRDDEEPTAVTTVVDAVLAEDDLPPLDPQDGAEPPPVIDQPDPTDRAERPPHMEATASPAAQSSAPATAEFSLADIAAQADPHDDVDLSLHPGGPEIEPEPDRLFDDNLEPETAQVEAVEVEAIEAEAVAMEAVEVEAIEIEAIEIEAIEIEAIEIDEIETPETAAPAGVRYSERVAAPPKRRGLFARRRNRGGAPPDGSRQVPDEPPATGPEALDTEVQHLPAEASAFPDEAVFISPEDSLFSELGPESTHDEPDADPRPRRRVTLPPDTAPPDSWVEPTPAEPSHDTTMSGEVAAPLDEDQDLFDHPPLPVDESTSDDDNTGLIGWTTDRPEEPEGAEQPSDLFNEPVEFVPEPPTDNPPATAVAEDSLDPATSGPMVPGFETSAGPSTQATDQIQPDPADGNDPPTQATDQIQPDPADDDWASQWVAAGWDDLDQGSGPEGAPADASSGDSMSSLVLFPDEFPPLPLEDPRPSEPALASSFDGDWANIPLDAEPAQAAPDTLSLFDAEDPPVTGIGQPTPTPGLATDSEFFSLETMLDGLPAPTETDKPAAVPAADVASTPHQELALVDDRPAPESIGRSERGFTDLAELPEEPGRVLEDAFVSTSGASRMATYAAGASSYVDGGGTSPATSHNVFADLADLESSVSDDPFDDLDRREADDDRAGEKVEGHDWWDFDDATQRDDDRAGFRAAANATEAIDFSGTEQLHMQASDLAAPPTSTKPSDLDALDGPDSDVYEAALYAFFDAPGREGDGDDQSSDSIDLEYGDGPQPSASGPGKRQRASRRSKARRDLESASVGVDLFASAEAQLDDDRDDVDRWVEGTTDTHADWLERTKRSTFSNLLGILLALAAVVGMVVATVWVVSNL